MNNHHQATLPFDLDDVLVGTADPSIEHPADPQPLEHVTHHDDPDPTYPKTETNALRPRPSSKHTLAAFPHRKAAEPVEDLAKGEPAPLLLTIPEAGRQLGLGRTTMYELIGSSDIEVVHIGRAARVPLDSVHRFVDRLRSVSDLDR